MATLFTCAGNYAHENNNQAYAYRSDEQTWTGYEPNQFKRTLEELENSGFYYKNLSMDEACEKLKNVGPGYFLIRDSRSLNDYFTLTFKNHKNEIKNVRLKYSFGMFSFDITSKKTNFSEDIQHVSADSIVKLIETYTRKCQNVTKKTSSKIPYLKVPLRQSIPELKHLCRLSVNKGCCDTEILPKDVKQFVSKYPYTV